MNATYLLVFSFSGNCDNGCHAIHSRSFVFPHKYAAAMTRPLWWSGNHNELNARAANVCWNATCIVSNVVPTHSIFWLESRMHDAPHHRYKFANVSSFDSPCSQHVAQIKHHHNNHIKYMLNYITRQFVLWLWCWAKLFYWRFSF